MKIIFLLFGILAAASATDSDFPFDTKEEMELETLSVYRQESLGNKFDLIQHILTCIRAPDSSKINFYLYTKEQPEKYVLKVGDNEALKKSYYKTNRPTKFIIHGWFQEGDNFTADFKNAYLAKEDYNIIGVDWYAYSQCVDYPRVSKSYIPKIGETVARMMVELKEYGADISTFHVIGHSFGAQVAGYVGKAMKSYNSKLPWITGLDPAGPLYADKNVDKRLDQDDADFVDVIHTNSYYMGTSTVDGHANFYPNGGIYQMQCKPRSALCNHQSSVAYYLESIVNPKSFCSIASQSYFDYLTRSYCSGNGDKKYMGAYVDKSASGFYYLITNEMKPYGRDCQGSSH